MMTYDLFIQKYEKKLEGLGYVVKQYPNTIRLYSKNFYPQIGYGFTLSIFLKGPRASSGPEASAVIGFLSQLDSPMSDMQYIDFGGKDVNTFDHEFTRKMADYSNAFAKAISAQQESRKNQQVHG